MSDNWGYVTAGYVITGVTFVGYALSVRIRARRARRLLADETND
jgi:hypothetical protein